MNFEEIQHHLEPDNIGSAPLSIKLGVFITIFVVIIGAGIYFDTLKISSTFWSAIKEKEVKLKDEFKTKAGQAAKLELYKEQLAEMRASFGALLTPTT